MIGFWPEVVFKQRTTFNHTTGDWNYKVTPLGHTLETVWLFALAVGIYWGVKLWVRYVGERNARQTVIAHRHGDFDHSHAGGGLRHTHTQLPGNYTLLILAGAVKH